MLEQREVELVGGLKANVKFLTAIEANVKFLTAIEDDLFYIYLHAVIINENIDILELLNDETTRFIENRIDEILAKEAEQDQIEAGIARQQRREF